MSPRLDDELIVSLFKKYLNPDETKLYYVYGEQESPGWLQALAIFVTYLFAFAFNKKRYLVGLTDRRLLVLEVSSSYEDRGILPLTLADLKDVRVEGSPKEKKIHLNLVAGRRYEIKVKKELPTVKKQGENLEKIERYFRDFVIG